MACPPGKYQPHRRQYQCVACGAGRFARGQGGTRCEPCSAAAGGSGRYAGNIGGTFFPDGDQNYAWSTGAQLQFNAVGFYGRLDSALLYVPVPIEDRLTEDAEDGIGDEYSILVPVSAGNPRPPPKNLVPSPSGDPPMCQQENPHNSIPQAHHLTPRGGGGGAAAVWSRPRPLA